MPPRSPASSVRTAAAAASRGVRTEDAAKHPPELQQQQEFAKPPGTPGDDSCRRAMTAPPAAAAAGVGVGEGGGAFPLLFKRASLSDGRVDSTEDDAASETSTSSSDGSSSGGAIMALGAREEADSRDELIGILVPALGRAADGPGALGAAHAPSSPLMLPGALGVNVNTGTRGTVRGNISASSSSASSASSAGGRRIGHFRALSSTCLEGLEPAKNHHRRERSGSLLGEREIRFGMPPHIPITETIRTCTCIFFYFALL